MTAIGHFDVVPPGGLDRALAHRHASVRQGDRKVQHEADCHRERRGEPAIHHDEREEAGVRRRHDSAGEPPGRRHRDAL
jgi:hypothetical protein